VAFVSMLKLASHWMPARRYALVSGVALFMGVVGATLAGVPLRALVDAFGWRTVMVASAILTAAVCVAIWLVVRDDPAERGYASYYPEPAAQGREAGLATLLAETFSHRNTWLLFFASGGFTCIVLTFAGLWGVPFLVTVRGFSATQAAATASAMLVAFATASIAYGPVSERLGRRKPVMLTGLVATMALWALVVFVPMSPAALVAALVGVGIASASFILTFAFAKESVPAHLGGTVSGVANMGVMLGGMVMQPLVGLVLDRHWEGALAEGVRIYGAEAYRYGFAGMLAWAALGFVLLAFTKESLCRPLASSGGGSSGIPPSSRAP
jgi:predicted MFS family arabinose efflux permease